MVCKTATIPVELEPPSIYIIVFDKEHGTTIVLLRILHNQIRSTIFLKRSKTSREDIYIYNNPGALF